MSKIKTKPCFVAVCNSTRLACRKQASLSKKKSIWHDKRTTGTLHEGVSLTNTPLSQTGKPTQEFFISG